MFSEYWQCRLISVPHVLETSVAVAVTGLGTTGESASAGAVEVELPGHSTMTSAVTIAAGTAPIEPETNRRRVCARATWRSKPGNRVSGTGPGSAKSGSVNPTSRSAAARAWATRD